MKLYINTLGAFDINIEGQSVMDKFCRTDTSDRFFKFFLTFRNKKILPETIMDNLLANSESDNPENILNTSIFELKRIMESFLPEGSDGDKYISINFANGYYCMKTGENTKLDVDEFESLIKQGDFEYRRNSEKAIELYDAALKLYNGAYLSEIEHEVWLMLSRNYYSRLYIKTVYRLIEMLRERANGEESYISVIRSRLDDLK
jgi:two-component SAPR family response regulator